MSAGVTSAGAMLRASRKCAGERSWRTLTWPKPSTTPWSYRMRLATASDSTRAGSAGEGAPVFSVGSMRSQCDMHVLLLRVADELVEAFLAPLPRLLVAAERCAEEMAPRRVDPYVAGVDARCAAMRCRQVAREYRRAQSILNGIDVGEHRRLIGPRQHAQHRTEYFLVGDPHGLVDLRENCRRHEITVRELRVTWTLAATRELRSLFTAACNHAFYLREMRFRDERAHRRPGIGWQ